MENGDDDGREGRVCGRCARVWLLVERGGSATQGCSPSTQPVQHVPGCSFQRGGERRGTWDSGRATLGVQVPPAGGSFLGRFRRGKGTWGTVFTHRKPDDDARVQCCGGAADGGGGVVWMMGPVGTKCPERTAL